MQVKIFTSNSEKGSAAMQKEINEFLAPANMATAVEHVTHAVAGTFDGRSDAYLYQIAIWYKS